MRRLALTALMTLAIAAAAFPLVTRAQSEGAPPASKELFDELAARDAELFAALFDRCDADHLATMVTADFEFFHDKHGQTANSREQFIGGIRQMCEGQKAGTNYRARRELVPGTLEVYVLNNYGAVQFGEHRFYKLTRGKPEELVETGKFVDLWKKEEDGVWRLARVISYDHRLTR